MGNKWLEDELRRKFKRVQMKTDEERTGEGWSLDTEATDLTV